MNLVEVFRRYGNRIVVLSLLALLYGALTQKYRAYDIDNPWFLSFSYNFCHGGPETDEFQQVRYPLGMDGVHLFGKLPALAQCAVFNRIGWTPPAVVALNLTTVVASLCLLWNFFLLLGYKERWVSGLILFLGITEPVVAMVEKARYEFLGFLLLATALWLAAKGMEIAAALFAVIAVETEPAAVVIPLVVWLFLASRTERRKLLVPKIGLSLVIAGLIYLGFHPGAIQEMLRTPALNHKTIFGATISEYFVDRKRHLPELGMLVLGCILYWRRRAEILDHTGARLAMIVLVFFFVWPHPNVAYLAFGMPFFLWAALEGYDYARGWIWVPATAVLFILVQYAYLYRINRHEGFTPEDFSAVSDRITGLANTYHLSDPIAICGDYSLWFSHPKNYHTCPVDGSNSLQNSSLYVCFDEPLEKGGLSGETNRCADLENVISLQELSSMNMRGHPLHFLVRR